MKDMLAIVISTDILVNFKAIQLIKLDIINWKILIKVILERK